MKAIMGYLDAAKYHKIKEHLKNNEINVQKRIDAQYFINRRILNNFNNTIEDIKYNGLEIRKKLLDIKKSVIGIIVFTMFM